MIRQFWAIVRRELFYMWRDRGLRNILLVGPILGVFLFGGIYSAQTLKDIPTAIVDLDQTSSSRELAENLRYTENLRVTAHPGTYNELESLIRYGKVVVGVVIPENFARDVAAQRQTRVLMIIDGSNMVYSTNASSAVLTVTRTISAQAGIKTLVARGIGLKQAQDAYQSVEFKEEPWFNPTLNYGYFLLLGLFVNIWQQCCTMIASVNIIGETGVKSWLQIKAAGISKFRLFFNKSIAHLITFMVLILPVYFLAFSVLKLPIACGFGTLLLFTLVFAVALHSIGTLMSSVAGNSVDSTRFGMMVALPSFVLSGFTWPLEAMPQWLQHLVWILPQTWFFQGLNYLTFKNPGGDFMSRYYLCLLLIALVCYGLTTVITVYKER